MYAVRCRTCRKRVGETGNQLQLRIRQHILNSTALTSSRAGAWRATGGGVGPSARRRKGAPGMTSRSGPGSGRRGEQFQ
ncbi:hypothetical protein EYF80_007106 [Liparis tanakae]|uniref:Uncharacterized protein n=1 Tax=Liparis tanakae TaxID=230148 RepID=A0A4Z2IYL5_9TELE|nr:hypothetical protein EYF80_007106 [Liparis tanakae]